MHGFQTTDYLETDRREFAISIDSTRVHGPVTLRHRAQDKYLTKVGLDLVSLLAHHHELRKLPTATAKTEISQF